MNALLSSNENRLLLYKSSRLNAKWGTTLLQNTIQGHVRYYSTIVSRDALVIRVENWSSNEAKQN